MFGLNKLKDSILDLAAALAGCARTAREADARLRAQLQLDGPPPGEVIEAAKELPETNGRRVRARPLS